MPGAMRQAGRFLAALLVAASLPAGSVHAVDGVEQRYPDVIAASVQARDAETFDFDVTVSSPYDTPQRYADGFRVAGKDGAVYGERKLLHDHAAEQPFTRDLHGVRIPRHIRSVVLQARDQKFGYGGRALELILPGR
ncbi:hypothetical protein [Sulfuritalea sp.]|uniref:hypothetical protein n=1 Tax=Sulfuritalea sp. TaxID=2480090 RepID=UPI00286E66E3|nr:hypothetical protein [Sulfuritalea sp.]